MEICTQDTMRREEGEGGRERRKTDGTKSGISQDDSQHNFLSLTTKTERWTLVLSMGGGQNLQDAMDYEII